MRLELRAHTAPWWGGIEFLARCVTNDRLSTAEPLVMKERDPAVCCEPTFTLDREQAQILMDDLWMSGLRPTEGTGSAGALAATQRHLDDMRRLVFERGELHEHSHTLGYCRSCGKHFDTEFTPNTKASQAEELAELEQLRAEVRAYREGGVTEEILRRNDGYIKVGRGCVIALASELPVNTQAER